MLDSIIYILTEAFEETLFLVPFLFAVFLIIEVIESKSVKLLRKEYSKNKGPAIWATIGIVPHCGFGVMGAKLFSRKFITIGSMIAILISITDEAVFLLLTHENGWFYGLKIILIVVGIKLITALLIGYLVDFIFHKKNQNQSLEKLDATLSEAIDDNLCCKEHKHGFDHETHSKLERFLIHPLKHALPLIIFIFIVNIIMGSLIYIIGEQAFIEFFNNARYFQPLLAILVGLIPNCVGSIILINLYIEGVLIFPALITGLVAQAGLSTLVLFKENKNIKENLFIIAIKILVGLILGYIMLLFF